MLDIYNSWISDLKKVMKFGNPEPSFNIDEKGKWEKDYFVLATQTSLLLLLSHYLLALFSLPKVFLKLHHYMNTSYLLDNEYILYHFE